MNAIRTVIENIRHAGEQVLIRSRKITTSNPVLAADNTSDTICVQTTETNIMTNVLKENTEKKQLEDIANNIQQINGDDEKKTLNYTFVMSDTSINAINSTKQNQLIKPIVDQSNQSDPVDQVINITNPNTHEIVV